ncbi:MAG: hypothetical protein EBU88_11645 [Acidobacteria bacterium]|nr:hypothetical protein [Acidobacteriota bacterium]
MITSDKERFAISDDVPENLFVASDANEDALLGSKTEGLILELATIRVYSAEGADWRNSTDVGAATKEDFEDGFGTITA